MNMQTRKQRVWVVFTDQTDLMWLRILRRGFRHCFVLIHDGRNWITVDPLSSRMEVVVQDVPEGYNLPQWLKTQGYTVLRTRMWPDISKPAPVSVFSCVEAVKRILGIHKRFIFTPWQMYRYLARNTHSRGVLSWEV